MEARSVEMESAAIKAAALLLTDGTVITRPPPARHSTLLLDAQTSDGWATATQGFITNEDKFVTRSEAYEIAKAAGQIIYPEFGTPTPGTLYTEDLW